MFESSLADWLSLIAAIVALGVSVLAVWQTSRELKVNNKQFLFEKRLGIYIKVKKCLNIFNAHQKRLDRVLNYEDKEPFFNINFIYFVFSSEIEDFQEPFYTDDIGIDDFVMLINRIKIDSKELKFLFNLDEDYKNLVNFLNFYIKLLNTVYFYKIIKDRIDIFEGTEKEKQEFAHTSFEREKLDELKEAIRNCKAAYKKIDKEKIFESMERQIDFININRKKTKK